MSTSLPSDFYSTVFDKELLNAVVDVIAVVVVVAAVLLLLLLTDFVSPSAESSSHPLFRQVSRSRERSTSKRY